MCKFLIKSGIQFKQNKVGNTPLHWAIQNSNPEIVKLLLQDDEKFSKQIDVLLTNQTGKSCITYAYDSNNTEVINLVLNHISSEQIASETGGKKPSKEASISKQVHKIKFKELNQTEYYVSEVGNESSSSSNTLEDNLKDTGAVLWASSVILGRWLLDLSKNNLNLFKNKTAIELGAGCGFPSIVVGSTFDFKSLFVTDLYSKAAIENLKENLQSTKKLEKAKVETLDWTKLETSLSCVKMNGCEKFDVVFGADLVYRIELVAPLLETILTILGDNGKFFYVTTESNRAGFSSFLKAMKEAGFSALCQDAPTCYIEKFYSWFDESPSAAVAKVHFHEVQTEKFKLYTFERIKEEN